MTKRKRGEPFFVLTPVGRKAIGEIKLLVDNRLMLVKKVRRKDHYHRNFAAWALQHEAFPRLREMGVWGVRLEVDDGSILEVSLERIERFGFRRDLGHGAQIFLRETYWHVLRPPAGQPQQLRLFAAGGEV